MRAQVLMGGFIVFLMLMFLFSHNLTTEKIVNFMLNSMFVFFGTTFQFSLLLKILFSMIMLYVAFAFLACYGAIEYEKRIGIIAGVIGFILTLIIFQFSIFSLMFGFSILLSAYIILPLSNTYFQELGRWKFFRTGAKSVSSVMMLINVFIALNMYITISQEEFSDSVKMQLINNLVETMKQTKEIKAIEAQGIDITSSLKERIESMELIQNYIKFMPIFIPLLLWLILEMLRNFISLLSGLVCSIMLRLFQ